MKRLIAFITILMLLAPMAMAATGTVRIWGTNKDNANQNTSVSLAPQNITVRVFDGNTTTFSSTVNNASDTLTFSIANQTASRVMELRINGTVINGYQVNSTGWVTFTRIQRTSNQTYKLTPAINMGGYNWTWAAFADSVGIGTLSPQKNLSVAGGMGNINIGASTAYNAIWLNGGTSIEDYTLLSRSGFALLINRQLGEDIIFRENGASASTHMTIKATTGNVGIGITTPTDKLTVSGTINGTNFVGNGSGLKNVTWNTVTQPTYSINTVYQNTNDTILITFSSTEASSNMLFLDTDASNPPSTRVCGSDGSVSQNSHPCTAIILANHFFRFVPYGGTPVFERYIEWRKT